MRRFMTVSTLAVLAAAAPYAAAQDAAGSVGPPLTITIRGLTLHQDMRRLWSDHVIWTRMYIIGAVNEDGSATVALDRLMRNQEELGQSIRPFYGEAAAAQLTSLLKQHIRITVEVVAAAKAGDATKESDAARRWHENGTAIAIFFSTANPNLSRRAVLDMLGQHLDLTEKAAAYRIQKNWSNDQANFDAIYTQAMGMADTLSDAIIKQFPTKV